MATVAVEKAIRGLADLIALSPHLWVDYDEGADVLYLSFRRPQQAKDSTLEKNVVYHYDGEELVGLTIMGFKAARFDSPKRGG